jgi:hypothetical protein
MALNTIRGGTFFAHLKAMGNIVSRIILFVTVQLFCWGSIAASKYIYSEGPIAFRSRGSLSAPTTGYIKPGENFTILKWNRHNTLIRTPDGQRRWIDKALVQHLAPQNDTGFLSKPLEVVGTNDKTLDTQSNQVRSASIQTQKPAQTTNDDNGEVVTSRAENDYIQKYDDNGQENGYLDRALAPKLDNLVKQTWKKATQRRTIADFCGGGYRSGNRSKCMCAQAVKEALVASKVCTRYPSGHARETHTTGSIKKSCPGLGLTGKLDPWKALGGSVIVYSGYAGKTPHNYGHIEIKIPVTAQLLKQMGKQSGGAKIGDFMYCSDFCRTRPTKVATNKVIAIYQLK